jgi:hypothetical protein
MLLFPRQVGANEGRVNVEVRVLGLEVFFLCDIKRQALPLRHPAPS